MNYKLFYLTFTTSVFIVVLIYINCTYQVLKLNDQHQYQIPKLPLFSSNYVEVGKSQLKYDTTQPFIDEKTFQIQTNTNHIQGHLIRVQQPSMSLHVYEANQHKGGCMNNQRASVKQIASENGCQLAINAGFFDKDTGKCLGNVISDGHLIKYDGVKNAHFGLDKNGYMYWGYFPHLLKDSSIFTQMIGGVGWLVRDGVNQVNELSKQEYKHTQQGNFSWFLSMKSARMIIGHDKEGKFLIMQVDGQTIPSRGANLYELSDHLVSLGFVNAINLDGGGSSTIVLNGDIHNYPSDICNNSSHLQFNYKCPRNVSTILCFKQPHSTSNTHLNSPRVDVIVRLTTNDLLNFIIIVLIASICFNIYFILNSGAYPRLIKYQINVNKV